MIFDPNAPANCQDCGKRETRATIVAVIRGFGRNFSFTLQCADCATKDACARGYVAPPAEDCFF